MPAIPHGSRTDLVGKGGHTVSARITCCQHTSLVSHGSIVCSPCVKAFTIVLKVTVSARRLSESVCEQLSLFPLYASGTIASSLNKRLFVFSLHAPGLY